MLDTGNDDVLLDDVDDTKHVSLSASSDLRRQSRTSRTGRKVNLPARFLYLSVTCTCIDCDCFSLCFVWLLSTLVLSAYMYESVYGKSVLVHVLYGCWCCGRSSLMVSVWVLLILAYVLYGRCRRG